LTENVHEYFEAIIRASKEFEVPVEELTLDQFTDYVDHTSLERGDALKSFEPAEIQESDWEKVKELSIIIDDASKDIAEKHRFRVAPSATERKENEWKIPQLITVSSGRRVFELTMLTTSLLVALSVGVLFLISLFNKLVSFEAGIVPAIAIPLIVGSIVSSIIFLQFYLLTKAKAEVERLNRTDPLTGLLNRHFFTELIEMELAVASRYDFSSSLLLIDLDHFKRVNDVHGYLTGDEVIKIISKVVRRNVRRTDIVGRFGGEELMVFLPHTPLEGALVAADRLRRIISESELIFNDERIDITASIGVTSTELGISEIDQLIQTADSAMYMAKKGGRNQVESFPQIPQESGIKAEVIELRSE
jgi:diguanylate cyclase (GGDEF)-like protein